MAFATRDFSGEHQFVLGSGVKNPEDGTDDWRIVLWSWDLQVTRRIIHDQTDNEAG